MRSLRGWPGAAQPFDFWRWNTFLTSGIVTAEPGTSSMAALARGFANSLRSPAPDCLNHRKRGSSLDHSELPGASPERCAAAAPARGRAGGRAEIHDQQPVGAGHRRKKRSIQASSASTAPSIRRGRCPSSGSVRRNSRRSRCRPIDLRHAAPIAEIQHGSAKRVVVAGIGERGPHFVRRKAGKFARERRRPWRQPGQLDLMIGEKENGRRRGEFLPLEQHRNARHRAKNRAVIARSRPGLVNA